MPSKAAQLIDRILAHHSAKFVAKILGLSERTLAQIRRGELAAALVTYCG